MPKGYRRWSELLVLLMAISSADMFDLNQQQQKPKELTERNIPVQTSKAALCVRSSHRAKKYAPTT